MAAIKPYSATLFIVMRLKADSKEYIGFFGLLTYRLLLDWVYINIITVNFNYNYSGFVDYRSPLYCAISWGLFLVGYILIKKILYTDNESIFSVIITILYLISYIPFTTSVYAGFTPINFIVWNSIYWVVFLVAARISIMVPAKKLPAINFGRLAFDDRIVSIIGMLSMLMVIYVSGRYTHFRLNFDLFGVYDLRLEAREFSMSSIEKYLFSWTKTINSLMIAYYIIRKKKMWAALYFAVQMLSFGIDGSKATFFLPFLTVLAVFAYKRITDGQLKLLMTYGIAGVAFFAAIEYLLLDSYIVATLFIRRLLFVPSVLNVRYFDFFTTHTPDYFRGSFLRHFGAASPYSNDGGISRMIGKVYYSSDIMNCNNGLFSDAMANLGYLGMLIMPLIVVFFLHLLDRSTCGLPKGVVLASGIMVALNIFSSSFMTVLVTHGFLILIILTWMMRLERSEFGKLPQNASQNMG